LQAKKNTVQSTGALTVKEAVQLALYQTWPSFVLNGKLLSTSAKKKTWNISQNQQNGLYMIAFDGHPYIEEPSVIFPVHGSAPGRPWRPDLGPGHGSFSSFGSFGPNQDEPTFRCGPIQAGNSAATGVNCTLDLAEFMLALFNKDQLTGRDFVLQGNPAAAGSPTSDWDELINEFINLAAKSAYVYRHKRTGAGTNGAKPRRHETLLSMMTTMAPSVSRHLLAATALELNDLWFEDPETIAMWLRGWRPTRPWLAQTPLGAVFNAISSDPSVYRAVDAIFHGRSVGPPGFPSESHDEERDEPGRGTHVLIMHKYDDEPRPRD
jgi:hypothetical protein